jgi:hypothetical protein
MVDAELQPLYNALGSTLAPDPVRLSLLRCMLSMTCEMHINVSIYN